MKTGLGNTAEATGCLAWGDVLLSGGAPLQELGAVLAGAPRPELCPLVGERSGPHAGGPAPQPVAEAP